MLWAFAFLEEVTRNPAKAVENIGTVTEFRRMASAYVIDYRNLSDDEIKAALIPTTTVIYFGSNLQTFFRERVNLVFFGLIV
ncbi:MAG: hypothetical protein KAJ81_05045 [Candidatus Latescibacteria bacterium]|nr:hypothetical protein [Candidatus Latescibacterota bacterium]